MARERAKAAGKRRPRAPETAGNLTAAKRAKTKGTGPRLPAALRRELDLVHGKPTGSGDEVGSDSSDGHLDVYEYEEGIPEEESRKNRRFDAVENLEYELPEEFEDEDVPSEDEDLVGSSDDGGNERGDKHERMLEGITGIPSGAFGGKKKKGPVLMDAFDVCGSKSQINIHDLLDPLHGKSGFDKLRKSVQQLEKKPMTLHPPLPKVEREKLERKVAYEFTKKDITKWDPLVKRNREAPTIFFKNDLNLGFSTVGSIAYSFEPRTEFEKKMASLMSDPEIVEAHKEDGLKILELNKISIEDVKNRQDRLAKMRSLLFRHDMKQKHIKKIKSKTYHRILKKDKSKVAIDDSLMDPEAIQEEARKQEFKRAEERLTLKHKNKSKWAQRIMKRGLNAQDDGTRSAIAEQLRQHEQLTRKMNSMRDSSSEDSSSDDADEEDLPEAAETSKILLRARDKTLKVIQEEEETAKSGVLSLPFMVRGLQKKKEAAEEEAQLALRDYDISLGGKLNDSNVPGSSKRSTASGRKSFGAPKIPSEPSAKQRKSKNYDVSSDSEGELDLREDNNGFVKDAELPGQDLWEDRPSLEKQPDKMQEAVCKNIDIDGKDFGSKTTYEVAIFASGSWRKMPSEKPVDELTNANKVAAGSSSHTENVKESNIESDVESEDGMVDGIQSSYDKSEYELPSQSDLIRRAFAGDDVDLEFEKDKMEALNEEVAEHEKPLLLPGWGQWTDVQQKKGPPSWMIKEHEDAKRRREEALMKRKDAHLKNVIISEKPDKMAEKLHTKTLPFPFTSKELFEQNQRMPLGGGSNPLTSVRALNRPAVVKEAGIIIKPIKYEEVDPFEKSHEQADSGKSKPKKDRRQKGKGGNEKKGKK